MSSPPPTLPPLAATVLLASGAAVLLGVLVGIALLRWRRTVRWHGSIIAILVVSTAPVFALILNALWKAPPEEWRWVTTEPIVSGVAMFIVLLLLALASKRFGGMYQTTRKETLFAAGGALLMLVFAAASVVFFACGGFILVGIVGWPGVLIRFAIWPDGYEEIDAFVIMCSVNLLVWFVIFLDFQRSMPHRRSAQVAQI